MVAAQLKVTESRIPKVLNIKKRAKCTKRRSRSRWEQEIRKEITQRKEGYGRKLRRQRSLGKRRQMERFGC
jgi:hypothetical protein